jgi:hypothetical protein
VLATTLGARARLRLNAQEGGQGALGLGGADGPRDTLALQLQVIGQELDVATLRQVLAAHLQRNTN